LQQLNSLDKLGVLQQVKTRYFMSYPIGTPGKPWNDADKKAWFELQTV